MPYVASNNAPIEQGFTQLIITIITIHATFYLKDLFYITWARVLDLIARIKLCATISSPPCSFMMTSLRDELLIIDDRSCSNLGTPLRTESTSCKHKQSTER